MSDSSAGTMLPYSISRSYATALKAIVVDPYWMLGRQWQLGEFQGEDAGSPISVAVHHGTGRLVGASPGFGEIAYDGTEPLEMLLHAEPSPRDARTRLLLGQTLLGELDKRGIAAAASALPMVERLTDPEAEELRIASTTPIDGSAVLPLAPKWIDGSASLPGTLEQGPAAHREAFKIAVQNWLQHAREPRAEGASAWNDYHLRRAGTLRYEVAFEPEPPHPIPVEALTRAPLPGIYFNAELGARGDLDWYQLDQSGAAPERMKISASAWVAPTRLRFTGMPNARYWDFENGEVDLASFDAGGRDQAMLMVLDFMLVSSNDWFVIPMMFANATLPIASKVVVRDVFGGQTEIPVACKASPNVTASWSFFAHQPPTTSSPVASLAIPPIVAETTTRVLEEISIQRDELANLVWAEEHLWMDDLGRPRRVAANPEARQDLAAGRYRLVSHVPRGVFPLSSQTRNGVTGLACAVLGEPGCTPPTPQTRIASELFVAPEEIGSTGVTLRCEVKLGRWHDGSVVTWTTRTRVPAGGPVRRPLAFDQVGTRTAK